MKKENITKAYNLLLDLEECKKKLINIKKSNHVDYIEIFKHQSGAPEYSYCVRINDTEFNKGIKILIENHLIEEIKRIEQLINEI